MEIVSPNQVQNHEVIQHTVAGGVCVYLTLTMKDGSLFQCDIPLKQAYRLAEHILKLAQP